MVNAFLDRLRRLTDLTEASLAQLERLCVTAEVVDARSDIVKESASSDHLHIVLDGWACRYRLLSDGRRQLTALLLPGDIGDLDRLGVERPDFGIAALTPCTVALAPRARLIAALEGDPALRRVFRWLGCAENAMAQEWGVCLGRRSALERTAHLLCELYVRLDAIAPPPGADHLLPLTQEDLADTLGLSVVHVNRMLQTLRRSDLVVLEGRRFSIPDLDALAQLCDFRPAYLHPEGMSIGDRTGPRRTLRARPPRLDGDGTIAPGSVSY